MAAKTRANRRFGMMLVLAAIAAMCVIALVSSSQARADVIVVDGQKEGTSTNVDINTDTSKYSGGESEQYGIPDPANQKNQTSSRSSSFVTDLLKAPISIITNSLGITGGDDISGLLGGGSSGGGLMGMAAKMVTGAINAWLYTNLLVGLHWALMLITRIMRFRILVDQSGKIGDVPAMSGSFFGGDMFVKYFGMKMQTMKGIALSLTSIFMVLAGLRIMATSFSGSGTYALRQLVPRAGMTIFGIFGATWICQKLLDINWWMCNEMIGSAQADLWHTSPIQVFYKSIYSYGSAATTAILLILGFVMIIGIAILCILYWIRLAGIFILVFLSPVAFCMYFNENTEYITFTWLKILVATIFVQFIHAVIIAMFSSVMWAGSDPLEAALLGLTLLYLLLKVPKWMFKAATSSGGGGKTVVNVATTATKTISSALA